MKVLLLIIMTGIFSISLKSQTRYALNPKFQIEEISSFKVDSNRIESMILFNMSYDYWNNIYYRQNMDTIKQLLELSILRDSNNYRGLILYNDILMKSDSVYLNIIDSIEDSLIKSWGLFLYAGKYVNKSNDEKAFDLLDDAINYYNLNSDARTLKSELLVENKRYREAVDEKDFLITNFPHHVPYKSRVLEILAKDMGDYQNCAIRLCDYLLQDRSLTIEHLLFRLDRKSKKKVMRNFSICCPAWIKFKQKRNLIFYE